MGWQCDDGTHEGFLVALVPYDLPTERDGDCSLADRFARAGDLYREARYPEAYAIRGIRMVRIACDCGWRSGDLHVPIGVTADYSPCSCMLLGRDAEAIEDRCRELWQQHVRAPVPANALIMHRHSLPVPSSGCAHSHSRQVTAFACMDCGAVFRRRTEME